MFHKIQHIHFTGIGGAGMSGIAEILLSLNFHVSGSDENTSNRTLRLENLGGKIYRGHDARFIKGAQVLVYSSAISEDNVEIVAAKTKKIPVIPRAEMLAELMRLKYGIAVAGAHGKTTTTTMIATLLAHGDLDPTSVIGGKVNSFDGHAKKGEGEFLVAEADESDGSFLKLSPTLAVVTNLDHEHLDYYKTFENIQQTFLDFVNKVPFYGLVILCGDDENLTALIPKITKRLLTYGLSDAVQLQAREVVTRSWNTEFELYFRGKHLGHIMLPVPGLHNVLNALAAIAVGLELDLATTTIQQGIAAYPGIERRFELKGERDGTLLIDDYAHHPTEIKAAIAAAKSGWKRELIVVFQAHRYTRTRDCLETLSTAFEDADQLILTEIYPAGEKPLPGISGESLFKAVRAQRKDRTFFCAQFEAVQEQLQTLSDKTKKRKTLVLTLGAGDISQVARDFLDTSKNIGPETKTKGSEETTVTRKTDHGPR